MNLKGKIEAGLQLLEEGPWRYGTVLQTGQQARLRGNDETGYTFEVFDGKKWVVNARYGRDGYTFNQPLSDKAEK